MSGHTAGPWACQECDMLRRQLRETQDALNACDMNATTLALVRERDGLRAELNAAPDLRKTLETALIFAEDCARNLQGIDAKFAARRADEFRAALAKAKP